MQTPDSDWLARVSRRAIERAEVLRHRRRLARRLCAVGFTCVLVLGVGAGVSFSLRGGAGIRSGQALTSTSGQGGGSHPASTNGSRPTQGSKPASTSTSLPSSTTSQPGGIHPASPSVAPGLVVQAGDTSTVFVLGTAHCAGGLCLQLWRGTGGAGVGAEQWSEMVAPPSATPSFAGSDGSVESLVFANSSDGYAVEGPTPSAGPLIGAPVFVTVDGGTSWSPIGFGADVSVFKMVTSGNVFYAVLVHCTPSSAVTVSTCEDYRLGRSVVGTTSWSSVPIPGTSSLDDTAVGLGAAGGSVWLTYLQQTDGAVPQLLESRDGVPPFTTVSEPPLVGVTACALTVSPGNVIWADCPTGMMQTYLRSPDAGRHFSALWSAYGTIGASYDAISGDVAYRYLGTQSQLLQRTTDGGQRFATVARLVFSGGTGTQLVFTDANDGFALGDLGANQRTQPAVPTLLQTLDGGTSWTTVRF
jgi:hypothetical protein